jgi:hypothetical protein
MTTVILPRVIRLKDAPCYLGMDRNRFNKEVRTQLIEIPIGKQGIAFDRLDLDAWIEHYKKCSGRPAISRGKKLWDVKEHRASINVKVSGTLTNNFSDDVPSVRGIKK